MLSCFTKLLAWLCEKEWMVERQNNRQKEALYILFMKIE